MLIFMVLTSGQLLVRSMVEEKSNRVIEVLLSSCTPRDLMAGKILGLSGLGILQMLVYALMGLALALKTDTNLLQPEYFLLTLLYAILDIVLCRNFCRRWISCDNGTGSSTNYSLYQYASRCTVCIDDARHAKSEFAHC